MLVYTCTFLHNIWKDVKEDASGAFSLRREPVSLVVKETKTEFSLYAIEFFFTEYPLLGVSVDCMKPRLEEW